MLGIFHPILGKLTLVGAVGRLLYQHLSNVTNYWVKHAQHFHQLFEDVDLLYSWAFLSESFAITIIIKRDYQW